MPNLNQVALCGHLTRDPEVKYLQSGTAVCDLGLAVNDRMKKNNEWVDDPTFIDCTVFGKQAEFIGERGGKGAAVLITGRLKFESWEKDGQKRSKIKVLADRVQLLSSHNADSQERPERREEYSQEPQRTPGAPAPDEIPF